LEGSWTTEEGEKENSEESLEVSIKEGGCENEEKERTCKGQANEEA
jgi:hypothetical protein